MRIFIDSDGCPVVGIAVETAQKYGVPVTLVFDTAHMIQNEYAECIIVDKGSDSADLVLINRVSAGDIVITQDYGLAAMCLAKKAAALNQNGMFYTADNINRLLLQRHVNKKIRRAGGKSAHIKKRTPEQDEAFRRALINLLEKHYGKG